MQINPLGMNLKIAIKTNFSYSGDWSAFCCWYSLKKNVPDAEVSIYCNAADIKDQIFSWPRKCQVPFHLSKNPPKNSNLLVLDSFVVAIRELSEETLNVLNTTLDNTDKFLCDVNEDKYYSFVSYKNGFGNFVISEWIDNKVDCPFVLADNFMDDKLDVNGVKVLRIWKQIANIYLNLR